VLLFSETRENMGVAIGNKVWWEGLVVDILPWSQKMVASKRDV
jgi:hypothetical protein